MNLYKKAPVRIISLLLALTMIFAQFPALNLAVTANAANKCVVYVDGSYTGGDSDGTKSKPFTTIQAAYALLDGANDTDSNVIVICGDTTVDKADGSPIGGKPATITGFDGTTQYDVTLTMASELVMGADTKIERIKLAATAIHAFKAGSHKLTLNYTSTTDCLVYGSDVEIMNGKFHTVYAKSDNSKKAAISVSGGSIGNLAADWNETITDLTYNISGGSIGTLFLGPRSGSATIANLTVKVSGEPTISNMAKNGTVTVAALHCAEYLGSKEALAEKAAAAGFDTVITEPQETMIYVNGTVDTSGDGKTAATAVKTVQEAYALLDEANSMERNLIVICGDTAVNNTVETAIFTKPATITGDDGHTQYAAKLTVESALTMGADTKIEKLALAATAIHAFRAGNYKLILNYTSSTDCLVYGSDVEIMNGKFHTVYAKSDNSKKAVISVSGGSIGNLAADWNETIVDLTYNISGGIIGCVYGGSRNNGTANVSKFTVVLSGTPTITELDGKKNMSGPDMADTKLIYDDYAGDRTALLAMAKNFNNLSGEAAAAVVYVDGTAAVSGDGKTPETAFQTLIEAYNALPADNKMEKNVIVVCGDLTVEAGAYTAMASKAATITGSYGGTEYNPTITIHGSRLDFTADTLVENVTVSTSAQVRAETCKLILNQNGTMPNVWGKDIEIRNGSYTNVYAAVGKNITAAALTVSGGRVSNLGASTNAALQELRMTITGGTVDYVFCGARTGTAAVTNTVVTVSGTPAFTHLYGKKNLTTTEGVSCLLHYSGYAGDKAALLTIAENFDNVKQFAEPVTVYVDGTAEASGDGKTPATAFKTLQEAYHSLDFRNPMADNVIVLCGDLKIDLTKTLVMPAIPATLTGLTYGTTLAGVGTNPKNLVFSADTTIENLTIKAENSTQFQSEAGRFVLDIKGTIPSAVGSDIEIREGSYINVYVRPDANGLAHAAIKAGAITNLAAEANREITTLRYDISGGVFTNVWGGPRFGNRNISAVEINLSGAPSITGIVGKYTPDGAAAVTETTAWINFCDYAGAFSFTAEQYDHIGVIAVDGAQKASFASLQAAYQACKNGGTVTVRDDVDVTGTGFTVKPVHPVTIQGEQGNEAIAFTKDYFVFRGENSFRNVTLTFSQDQNSPTVLYYLDAAPDLSNAAIQGYYRFEKLTAGGNGVMIDFGRELTKQEAEGYPAITGETALERFRETYNALPDEVPRIQPFTTAEDGYAAHIYVATNGSDTTGNGSYETPFATVQRALKAVEEIPVLTRNNGVAVYIRGGSYQISDTIRVTANQCALPGMGKLLISAYPGEAVSLAGGVSLGNQDFRKVTDELVGTETWNRLDAVARENMYVADLKAMGITEFFRLKESKEGGVPVLRMNDQQLTLARYPDVGEVTFKSVINNGFGGGSVYEMYDLEPLTWKNTGNIYVRGSFFAEWWKMVGRIAEINSGNNTVKTNGYIGWGNASTNGGMKPGATNTHYYYNVLEELTIPGEWFLDEDTGLLYVYPPSGTAMDADDTLCLTTTDDQFLMKITGANDVIISDITFENGNGGINVESSSNVVIQNSIVQDMGGYGVKIYDCFKCGVIYSTIRRTDYIAFDTDCPSQTMELLQPTRCFLQNSLVYDIKVTACEIYGVGEIVSHNTIQYTRSMGVGIVSQESIFEYNEVTATSYAQSDAGGFYVPGHQQNQGNVIRYNYIHDSNPPGKNNARGIYMDDIGSGNYACYNIIENMALGLFVHSGDENVYVGNVLIDCKESATVSDACSITGNWTTRWGYFDGAVTWYDGLSAEGKAAWDARYPAFTKHVGRIKEAVADWNAGKQNTEVVNFTRAATDNTFVNNIIINGSDIITNTYAAPYTVLSDNTKYTEQTAEQIQEYSIRSATYAKLGIDISKLTDQVAATMALGQELDLLAPADVSFEADKVAFKWSKVHGANYYVLTVARDPDFTEGVQTFTTAEAEHSVVLSGPVNADYYWKVQAVSITKHSYNQTCTSGVGHFAFTKTGSLKPTDVLQYTPIIDAKKDAAYDSTGFIELDAGDAANPAKALGYLTWDADFLYAYVEVYKTGGIYSNPVLDQYLLDGDLDAYYSHFTEEDAVRLVINSQAAAAYDVTVHADGDGYYGYRCTLGGWSGDAAYQTRAMDGGRGYVVEFKIPVSDALTAGDQFSLAMELYSGTASAGVTKHTADAAAYTLHEATWHETDKLLPGTPQVDGVMDDDYRYSGVQELGPMSNAALGDNDDTELTGLLYALWDREYVYYYAVIGTDSVSGNPMIDRWVLAGDTVNPNTFKRFEDCLEITTQTQNNSLSTTSTIHADGQWSVNSYKSERVEYVAKTVKDSGGNVTGYVIEAKVPLYDIALEGHSLGIQFFADSIDTTGISAVDANKTKWEYYRDLVAAHPNSNTYNDGGTQKDIIRQTPLYQYRKDMVYFTLAGEAMKKAAYRVDFDVNVDGAAIIVKQGDTVIEPQADGAYVLETGSYLYSITADGCCKEEKAFTVAGMKHIRVALTEHRFVNGTCENCGHVCTHTGAAITRVGASLGKDITMKFYADLQSCSAAEAQMRFTMNGVSTMVSPGKQEGTVHEFVFTGIAPQCIGDEITAELFVGDDKVAEKTCSMLQYLNSLKDPANKAKLGYDDAKRADEYAKMLQLIDDLLVYGGAAQRYVGHNTDNLVSDGITGTTFAEIASTDAAVKNGTSVHFNGATVVYDSVNKMRFRFTAEKLDGVRFKIKTNDGTESEIAYENNGDGTYSIVTDGIYAVGFDDVVTVTAYKNGTADGKIRYSVKSYVYSKQNAMGSMAELAKATYNYGLSAKAFQAAQ